MSRNDQGRAAAPFAVRGVSKATAPASVRVRSGLALAALIAGLAVLTALAAIVVIVVLLALATTATS